MLKMSKEIVTLIIVLVCIILIFSMKLFKDAPISDLNLQISEKTIGHPHAPIRITEFVDFQCPSCASGFKYLKKFMRGHPNSVLLRVKYFPLTSVHRHALISARYAECASRQGKFWPFYELLFKRQGQWSRLDHAAPAFESIAQKARLDLEELNHCLQDKKVDELIEENRKYGSSLGVKSIPTYFVNGRIIVGNKSLRLELDRLIKDF
jgi:protein-disulfide isomerase